VGGTCASITSALDEVTDLVDDVTLILIEKQMNVNPKMVSISAMISMYLHMRCLSNFCSCDIVHVPAWQRTQKRKKSRADPDRADYRQRKAQSVAHATELVQGTKWHEFLHSFKKKDDLADCLCQAKLYVS
jgi:hypothetical protein